MRSFARMISDLVLCAFDDNDLLSVIFAGAGPRIYQAAYTTRVPTCCTEASKRLRLCVTRCMLLSCRCTVRCPVLI